MHAPTEKTTMTASSRATITWHLEIDGLSVGSEFVAQSDWDGADNEAAHRCMACHHPGSGYSIVSDSDAAAGERATPRPSTPS